VVAVSFADLPGIYLPSFLKLNHPIPNGQSNT